jgi:hypothetical protein
MLIQRPQQRGMSMPMNEEGCADMGEFVGQLFLARTLAHNAHLKTTSFAEHKTLEDFYNNIVDLADSLAQKYQGRTGQRLDVCVCEDRYTGDIASVLKQILECLECSRYMVADQTDSAIQNVIDEIVGLFLDTAYQLTLK